MLQILGLGFLRQLPLLVLDKLALHSINLSRWLALHIVKLFLSSLYNIVKFALVSFIYIVEGHASCGLVANQASQKGPGAHHDVRDPQAFTQLWQEENNLNGVHVPRDHHQLASLLQNLPGHLIYSVN